MQLLTPTMTDSLDTSKPKQTRRRKHRKDVLVRRATRLEQNESMPLYQFALTSAEISAVADISRLSRDDTGKLLGYQRPEIKKHVARDHRVSRFC